MIRADEVDPIFLTPSSLDIGGDTGINDQAEIVMEVADVVDRSQLLAQMGSSTHSIAGGGGGVSAFTAGGGGGGGGTSP